MLNEFPLTLFRRKLCPKRCMYSRLPTIQRKQRMNAIEKKNARHTNTFYKKTFTN